MRRVAIIGPPGSGKSTFARKLAARTHLPLVHLDYYYHDTKFNYYTNKAAWRARADKFAQAERWIIDGNFGATMAQRLERADTIYYFDMPMCLALKGVVRRWMTARHAARTDVPDGWQEKPKLAVLLESAMFRRHYAAGTRQLLAQNDDKTIVIFKNHRQVADYLRTL